MAKRSSKRVTSNVFHSLNKAYIKRLEKGRFTGSLNRKASNRLMRKLFTGKLYLLRTIQRGISDDISVDELAQQSLLAALGQLKLPDNSKNKVIAKQKVLADINTITSRIQVVYSKANSLRTLLMNNVEAQNNDFKKEYDRFHFFRDNLAHNLVWFYGIKSVLERK